MSFIFAGLCAVYLGVIIFKKDFTLLKTTKDLLKKLGWYSEPIIIDLQFEKQKQQQQQQEKEEKQQEKEKKEKKLIAMIEKKIERQKDKKIFMTKQKEVCKEIVKINNDNNNVNVNVNHSSMFSELFDKLKYYSGFEDQNENEFIVLSDQEISYESEEECLLDEQQ